MDKRTFLALLLTAFVIVVTPMIFRTPPRPSSGPATPPEVRAPSADTLAPASSAPATAPSISSTTFAPPKAAAETTVVSQAQARYAFTSAGAVPLAVDLQAYRSYRPPTGSLAVQLASPFGGPLLRIRAVLGRDTVAFDSLPFVAQRGRDPHGADVVTYAASGGGRSISVSYELPVQPSNRYLVNVHGRITGAPPASALLIALPPALQSAERDTLDDIQHRAFGYRAARGGVESIAFSKLDPAVARIDSGPLRWAAVRDKYFLFALIATANDPIAQIALQGAPRMNKVAAYASAAVVLPLQGDGFSFALYAGPQEFERLQALGNDMDQVNPYAGWLHAVVQPFATIVMRILLWMKRSLPFGYGWVLVIFGVFVRLVLWPLNQSAMRSSIKMQRLQPQLTEIQKRYKTDPEKQRDALMKVYQEHGMSPFSPMMGCLPMLLPMPVLFALYFVFQNTIEFRGVPFLWLPDLSMLDPFYITPIVMGASMFLLSWIGMRGVPPTPQTKMMAYMMPGMFTFMFLKFPSGLNLYYAVQNLAALPQQWILSKERAKTGSAAAAARPAVSAPGGRRVGT